MKKLSIILSLIAFSMTTAVQADNAIEFSHELHVTDMEIECSQCHASAEKSTAGTDDLFNFDHDVCSDCHSDAIEEDCEVCHVDVDDNPAFGRILHLMPQFSHKNHLGGHLDCSSCHEGIAEKSSPDEQTVSHFTSCLACHEKMEPHPVSHRLNWESSHGIMAGMDGEEECSACHSENYCMNCHEGDNSAYQVHPQNFMMMHKTEFMTGGAACETCHEPETCVECHKINNVRPLNHQSTRWLIVGIDGDGGNHGPLGVSRIEYCATCHESAEEDPVCMFCHEK